VTTLAPRARRITKLKDAQIITKEALERLIGINKDLRASAKAMNVW
jgi:hypothetical protein